MGDSVSWMDGINEWIDAWMNEWTGGWEIRWREECKCLVNE